MLLFSGERKTIPDKHCPGNCPCVSGCRRVSVSSTVPDTFCAYIGSPGRSAVLRPPLPKCFFVLDTQLFAELAVTTTAFKIEPHGFFLERDRIGSPFFSRHKKPPSGFQSFSLVSNCKNNDINIWYSQNGSSYGTDSNSNFGEPNLLE